jgi:hypothetical protein
MTQIQCGAFSDRPLCELFRLLVHRRCRNRQKAPQARRQKSAADDKGREASRANHPEEAAKVLDLRTFL